jgi:hypothetical protein
MKIMLIVVMVMVIKCSAWKRRMRKTKKLKGTVNLDRSFLVW